ncbi:MAG: hypothetical protein E4H01_04030 [Lysobacterales bacterium]|nr:MAG: hypothetical protein E4H01_04030 [Xanthomonadales bacterium]
MRVIDSDSRWARNVLVTILERDEWRPPKDVPEPGPPLEVPPSEPQTPPTPPAEEPPGPNEVPQQSGALLPPIERTMSLVTQEVGAELLYPHISLESVMETRKECGQ